MNVAEAWLRCAIGLAAWAGLRRSDCLNASPANYNREQHTLTIAQQKTGHRVSIPISTELAAILDSAPPTEDPNTPFLQAIAGRKVTAAMVQTQWPKCRHRAGLNPRLTFHDLRRTLAVSLYEISHDLRVVQQMLGHSSLFTTTRYLEHRDPEKLRPFLEALWTPKGKDTVQ